MAKKHVSDKAGLLSGMLTCLCPKGYRVLRKKCRQRETFLCVISIGGNMLDEERRKEIVQEEKWRRKIRNAEKNRQACGCLIFFIIVIGAIIYFASNGSSSSTTNQSNSATSNSDVKVTLAKKTVTAMATTCVENHKSIFKPKIQGLLDGTDNNPQSATKKGAYTIDECKQIIMGLDKKGYSDDEIKNVTEGKYWIGMDAKLLIFSIGFPNDYSSTTTTVFGSSSQFVYGNPLNNATYIYMDNGKVTSYQN